MAADSYRSHCHSIPTALEAASRALACPRSFAPRARGVRRKVLRGSWSAACVARSQASEKETGRKAVYRSTPRGHVVPARGRCLRFFIAGGTMISTHEAVGCRSPSSRWLARAGARDAVLHASAAAVDIAARARRRTSAVGERLRSEDRVDARGSRHAPWDSLRHLRGETRRSRDAAR